MTLRGLGHDAPARASQESEGFGVEGVLPGEFFLGGRYADDVMTGRSPASSRLVFRSALEQSHATHEFMEAAHRQIGR
ncbi:hypothetical protein GCM10010207_33420 [Streptomyces atratus]|nr:hypothetical protein GCM10010207_33420 [Streptomyces atratus]